MSVGEPARRPVLRWVLVLLTGLVLINNACWLGASDIRVNFDLPVHGRMVLQQLAALLNSDLHQFLNFPLQKHGPLGYDVAACFLLLTGVRLENLLLSNSVWIPVYVVAIFGIGRRLYDEETGFLASVYFLSIPLFVDHVKQFPLEIGMHALVMLALWLLFESDLLRRRGLALLCGVTFGLSLLTKAESLAIWGLPCLALFFFLGRRSLGRRWQRTLFLVGGLVGGCWLGLGLVSRQPQWRENLLYAGWPCLLLSLQLLSVLICALLLRRVVEVLYAGAWSDPWRERFCNLLLAMGAAAVVASPFLLTRDLASVVHERIYSAANGFAANSRWIDLAWYPQAMLAHSFHYFYSFLLLVGIVCFFYQRQYEDRRRLALLAMGAYLFTILTLIPARFEYYLINLLGFSSLVATSWIPPLRSCWRTPALTLLFAWATVQIFGWTLLPRGLPPEALYPLQTFDSPRAYSRILDWSFLPMLPEPPAPCTYVIPQILRDVSADAGGECLVLVPPTPTTFTAYHPESLQLFAAYMHLPTCVVREAQDLHVDTSAPLKGLFGNPLDPELGLTVLRRGEPLYFVLQGDHPTEGSTPLVLGFLKQIWSGPQPIDVRRFRTYEKDCIRLQIYRLFFAPPVRGSPRSKSTDAPSALQSRH